MMKRQLVSITCIMVLSLGSLSFSTTYDGFEISKQVEIFVTFFMKLNQNYVDETNPAELMDTAINAITKDLDPYTKFWTEQDIEASKIRNTGQYSGIGASIHMHKERLYINEPYKNFPADKAGMKAGDEIIEIDDLKIEDFKGEAKDLLRGETGSEVKITYIRQGKKHTVKIKRDKIDIDAVPYYALLEDNSAYIVLQKFNKKASSQVIKALKELKSQGADKVILDLRGNPGGLLKEAVNVCNVFVDKGERIVYTQSAIESNRKEYKTLKTPIDTKIPLAILIDQKSASASEIVSGTIQDLDRGVIIGQRSFGKGLVQSTRKLKYNTLLKVTTSRYYIPSGRCIQALDYWNKDEDGKPIRTKNSDYNEFKTLNNKRTVYDGGGILPDIEIKEGNRSQIAKTLLREKIIFNYATHFYYNNKIDDIKSFHLSETNYKDFLDYLYNTNFSYETKTEQSLKKLFDIAEKEDIRKHINTEYNTLLASIQSAKKKALNDHSEEIKLLLTNEILKRYFYKEGSYEYNITHNEGVRIARETLVNTNKYNNILGY